MFGKIIPEFDDMIAAKAQDLPMVANPILPLYLQPAPFKFESHYDWALSLSTDDGPAGLRVSGRSLCSGTNAKIQLCEHPIQQ